MVEPEVNPQIQEEPKVYSKLEAVPFYDAAYEAYKRTKQTMNLALILFFLPIIIYFATSLNRIWSAGLIVISITLATTYIFKTVGELIRLENKYGLPRIYITNLFRKK